MRRDYRTPTEEEKKRLDAARTLVQQGIEGEQGILPKLSTTYAKGVRDEIRRGMQLRESVDKRAREGEAYNQAGYAKGGKVKKYAEGGSTLDDLAEGKMTGSLSQERDEDGLNVYGRARRFLNDKLMQPAEEPPRARARPPARKTAGADRVQKRSGDVVSSGRTMRDDSPADRMRYELNRAGVEEIPSYGRSMKPPTAAERMREELNRSGLAKGGNVKAYAKGGSIDGCAQRGKTKGRVV